MLEEDDVTEVDEVDDNRMLVEDDVTEVDEDVEDRSKNNFTGWIEKKTGLSKYP